MSITTPTARFTGECSYLALCRLGTTSVYARTFTAPRKLPPRTLRSLKNTIFHPPHPLLARSGRTETVELAPFKDNRERGNVGNTCRIITPTTNPRGWRRKRGISGGPHPQACQVFRHWFHAQMCRRSATLAPCRKDSDRRRTKRDRRGKGRRGRWFHGDVCQNEACSEHGRGSDGELWNTEEIDGSCLLEVR